MQLHRHLLVLQLYLERHPQVRFLLGLLHPPALARPRLSRRPLDLIRHVLIITDKAIPRQMEMCLLSNATLTALVEISGTNPARPSAAVQMLVQLSQAAWMFPFSTITVTSKTSPTLAQPAEVYLVRGLHFTEAHPVRVLARPRRVVRLAHQELQVKALVQLLLVAHLANLLRVLPRQGQLAPHLEQD